jgi:HK97 family phage major capsid protein
VLGLGAQFVTGVQFNLGIPLEDTVMTASFVGEAPGSDVAQSDSSFKQAVLSPHAMQATTSVSRQLLSQSSDDLEVWLRNRIARAHAQLLDKAALHGTGTVSQPVGLANLSGVGLVSLGTNGAAASSDSINSLESTVAAANGDVGSMAFLTNAAQRSKLRKIPSMASGVIPLWDGDRMLGYAAVASNQCRSDLTKGSGSNLSAIFFGNWNTLMIVEATGALEIVYDPYAQKRQGMIQLTMPLTMWQ